jgi:hypothetical protein
VRVRWLPGAVYANLTGYRLWRSEAENGESCALIPDPAGALECRPAGALAPAEVTTARVSYIDDSVAEGRTYHYRVSAVTAGGESALSGAARGAVLPRSSSALSPPAAFKAAAPYARGHSAATLEFAGIYLSWCPNPVSQGVTSYKVYRSSQSLGPYGPEQRIATIPPVCLDGVHRW